MTALNFLERTSGWTEENVLENNDFVMTNLDSDGNTVPLHNQLVLKDKMSFEKALALFRTYPIGCDENTNTHLYRFYPQEEPSLGTVEWFALDNCMCNVFVPSYPMLLTDTWGGYKVQLGETEITETKPDSGDWYYRDGEYHIHPDGWEKSYIGTLSALTNLLTYGELSEAKIALAENTLQNLQSEFISRFEDLTAEIRAAAFQKKREAIMTAADKEMAAQVHDLSLALYHNFAQN